MKQKRWIPWCFQIIVGLALFSYTWILASVSSYTERNLSTVGYWEGKKTELILWGVLAAVYYVGSCLSLSFLIAKKGFRPLKKQKGVILTALLAGAILIGGVLIPYLPEKYPVLSNVHIGASLAAPFILLGALVGLLIILGKAGGNTKLLWGFLILAMEGAASIFFWLEIITSVLEIYVVGCLVVLLLGMRGVCETVGTTEGEETKKKSL